MTVRDELFDLQLEQLKHDQKYHKDIQALPLHHRLNHMALHFAKYAGRLAEHYQSPDVQTVNQTIVDLFLISLVTANMLNTRLADHLSSPGDSNIVSLEQLGSSLAEAASHDYQDAMWLARAVMIPSGKIAKACETLDHVEAYPYREEIRKRTVELCSISLIAATKRDLNLKQAARARLGDVEAKLIFHGYV